MPIAPVDRQLLLIQQVGDVDAISGEPISPLQPGSAGIVMINAERLWNMYVDKLILPTILGATIFDQYFKRDAVGLVIGVLESRVDFAAVSGALSIKLSQRIQARLAQQQRFQKELERLEFQIGSMVPAEVGLIKRIEPIEPPVPGELSSPLAAVGEVNTFQIDANDPHYTGSPYWPSRANRSWLAR